MLFSRCDASTRLELEAPTKNVVSTVWKGAEWIYPTYTFVFASRIYASHGRRCVINGWLHFGEG